MDTTVIKNTEEAGIFRKDAKGNILFSGSGKYFREKKERYAGYTEPYKQLYKEQVLAVIKNSSDDIRSAFPSL